MSAPLLPLPVLPLPPLSPWRRWPRCNPPQRGQSWVRWPGQETKGVAYWDGQKWLTLKAGQWSPCTIRYLQLEWDSSTFPLCSNLAGVGMPAPLVLPPLPVLPPPLQPLPRL